MPETLLDIISADFKDYGSLELIEAKFDGTRLTLGFHVVADEYSELHPNWNVICRGVHSPWKPRGTASSVAFDNKLWIYGWKTGRDEWFAGDVWQMARTQ